MSRWAWAGGAAAALGGLLVAIALFTAYGASDDARISLRGYEVLSDTAVRVDFEVAKDESATALCSVRARGREGDEVGSALVRVGPSDDGVVRLSREVTTTARAVTGEVLRCEVEEPRP